MTIARAEPFVRDEAASEWLGAVRRDRTRLSTEVEGAVRTLNRVLRAHRAAVADPYVREVRSDGALARRLGYGRGVVIAAGRLDTMVEVTADDDRRKRTERLRPHERLAGTLGGRLPELACEELVLRARLDLDSEHEREAALQARIALESLLAELGSEPALGADRPQLDDARETLAVASNLALDDDLDSESLESVRATVEGMERVLARRRAVGP